MEVLRNINENGGEEGRCGHPRRPSLWLEVLQVLNRHSEEVMEMAGEVRIIAVRKEEIDVERLAAALLELAMQLARERAAAEKQNQEDPGL
jgi:hypothetical protein